MVKCGQCEYFKKRDSRYGGCITCCTNGIISAPTEDDYCSKGVEMDEAFENYKRRIQNEVTNKNSGEE